MLAELWNLLSIQFYHYGIESIGYFITGICFSLFYRRSTQRRRFHLIGNGCFVCALGGLLLIVLPALKALNPAFELTPMAAQWLEITFVCLATAFFWGSLLVNDFGKKQMFWTIVSLTLIQICSFFIVQYFFSSFNFICFLLASAWFVIGVTFVRMHSFGKTALFGVVGDSLIILGLFYIARELNFLPEYGYIPMLMFGGLSLLVLMAQLQFMESSCDELDEQLAIEKKRRTLFWDIAPFPILVSKLLDDSVMYINPAACSVLKITPEDIPYFHLKDYFADAAKRNELVQKVHQSRVLENFEVEMRSPRSGEVLWLNLFARVVEMDGELAMYINLHNVTKQKQVEEDLFKKASTDALTGLYNRRQFETMVTSSIANAQRYRKPYCVLMSDIDHFKKVNDTYGHETGDIVLKEVANLMLSTFRSSDIVGRFGGEEFVVFLADTDIQGAKVAAEKFRQAVALAHIEAEGKSIPVTISIGVTDTRNSNLLQLIKEADTALYYSKEHGRNQVSVYNKEMVEKTPGV